MIEIKFTTNEITDVERKSLMTFLENLDCSNSQTEVQDNFEKQENNITPLIQKYDPNLEFEVSAKTVASIFGWEYPKQLHRIQHLRGRAPFLRKSFTKGNYYLTKSFFNEHLNSEDYNKILRDVSLDQPIFLSTYDLNRKAQDRKINITFQPANSKKCHKARVVGFKGEGSKNILFMNTSDWRDSNPELWYKLCT